MIHRISRRKILKGAAILTAPFVLSGFSRGQPGYDIIAILSDSNGYSGLNADGTAGYNPSIDVTNEHCVEYKNQHPTQSLNFVCIAKDQFSFNNSWPTLSANPVVNTGGIGPGLTFMRDQWLPNVLGNNPTRGVMVVAQGAGGQGLVSNGYWAAPSGPGYVDAVTRINQAIALNSRNALKAFLWCTGANDAIAGISEAAYTAAMQNTIAALRANITGATNTPVLVEALVPAFVATNPSTFGPVNSALLAAPSNISKCGVCDMTGITGQTAVLYHLTADSQRTLGNRFYTDAYLNLSS